MSNFLYIRERFENYYCPEPNTGCWLWMGAVDREGYGKFWNGEKTIFAHKYSYMIYRGQFIIQDPLQILHRCDTPACVNPDHLWLGFHSDNMKDMSDKKRSRNQK